MHPRTCWGCGLQPGSFVGAYRGWRCPFAQTFVRGINLVMSLLAAVPYPSAASGCVGQTLDSGLRSTYPRAWWPLTQHGAADKRSRLHVTHAGSLWAGHACADTMGPRYTWPGPLVAVLACA